MNNKKLKRKSGKIIAMILAFSLCIQLMTIGSFAASDGGEAATEKFNLAIGKTYYFDLSGEASNIGTINNAVPDTTLHYVPFTYVGTVNAYSLDSSSSGKSSASNSATASDRSLFVADYNVNYNVSWNTLNENDLIFGKTFDKNYKLRSLSAGSATANEYQGGTPTTNEWNRILNKKELTNPIKNWGPKYYSWGQDTLATNDKSRAMRGRVSAAYWDSVIATSKYATYGWRPALEVLNPTALGADGLKAVEIDLNGGKLKDNETNINIVCAGNTFKAPSNEGLTRPSDATGTDFHWLGSDGETYNVGAEVPSTVTSLTAQWKKAPSKPTNFTELNTAITSATAGDTITLGEGTFTADSEITISKNLTIDLNGKTLNMHSNQIKVTGDNVTLTIVDSGTNGMITGTSTIVELCNDTSANVTINDGTVKSTVTNTTPTIHNIGTGTVTVSGGTVTGGSSYTIYNGNTGHIIVNGTGIVENTSETADSASAIDNRSTGTITVSGSGNVKAKNAPAIDNNGIGKITISGGTVTNDYIHFGTIIIRSVQTSDLKIVLEITGGTVENTATSGQKYAVYFNNNIGVDGTNVNEYYSNNGGAVGNVFPTPLVKNTTPNATFTATDTASGTLNNVTSNMKYSLDGGTNWVDITETTVNITSGITATNDIQVVDKGNGTTTADSDVQTIDVTQKEKPTEIGKTDCNTSANNDGKITNVDSNMQYKKSDGDWTEITGTSVTGLSNGTYYVRVKANGTVLASENETVTIDGYAKKTPTSNDFNFELTVVDYDGNAKAVTVTAKDSKNLGTITVKYNGAESAPTNAGTYPITVTTTGSADYNAITNLSLGDFTINKIAYTGEKTASKNVVISGKENDTLTLPTLPTGASYGTPQAGGTVNMTAMSVNDTTLTFTAPSATAGQTGTITVPVTGATNYNNYSVTVTITYVAKTPQDISYAITGVDKTYGDAKFTNPLTKTTVDDTITYSSDDTSVATVNESTGEVTVVGYGTDGMATITATVAETSTHASDTATYTVNVAKKAIIAKPNSFTIRSNEAFPTLTWGIDTAIEGETLTATNAGSVAMEIREKNTNTKVDTVKVGTFDIVFTTEPNFGTQNNYTITMGKGTLTVTQYVAPPIGGTGGGGSYIPTTPKDDVTITVTNPIDKTDDNATTEGVVNVKGKTDSKGNLTVDLSSKNVEDAYNKAVEAAKKNGNDEKEVSLVLNVTNKVSDINSFSVNLPKTTQETIIEKKILNTVVVVNNPDIKIGLNLETVKSINKQAKADVNLVTEKVFLKGLSSKALNIIGTRPVYYVTVSYGSKTVEDFDKGRMYIELSYNLEKGEDIDNIYGVGLDDKGKAKYLKYSAYDEENKVLKIGVDQCSTYGIGYKDATVKLEDIDNHEAKDSIAFVANRGLYLNRYDDFNPDNKLTKLSLASVLGKLAEVNDDVYKKNSFKDVKSSARYSGYVRWATNNDLINKTTKTTYSPMKAVTYGQLNETLSKYADLMNLDYDKAILAKEGTEYNSRKVITRGEFCQIVEKLVEANI